MTRFIIWALLAFLLIIQASLLPSDAGASGVSSLPPGAFEDHGSARLIAIGGAGVSLAEDGSGLYINPAGLTASDLSSVSADYFGFPSGGRYTGGGVSVALRKAGISLAAGFMGKAFSDRRTESLLSAAAGWRILEGAQGSFLSVGGAIRSGILSYDAEDGCPVCSSPRISDSAVNGDLGVMLRPLPIVSIAYSLSGINEPVFKVDQQHLEWRRVQRWGISWFWEGILAVSWQRDIVSGRSTDRYGFSLKTGYGIELMTGFSEEGVTGGAGASIGAARLAVAFTPRRDYGVETWFSVQWDIKRDEKVGGE